MAGAGYDIGFSAAQASTMTQAQTAFTNIVFSGGTLTGGGATTLQKETADATATSKSPGAVNDLKDSSGDLPALPGIGNQGSIASPPNNNTLWLAIVALAALILYKNG